MFPADIWARYIWLNTTLHLYIYYNRVLCVILLFKGHLERSPKWLVRHATEMRHFTVSQHLMLGFTLTSSLISSSVNIILGPFFCCLSHSSFLPLHASHLLTSLSFSSQPFSLSCCALHTLSLFLRSSLFLCTSPLLCSSLPLSSCSSITISCSS